MLFRSRMFNEDQLQKQRLHELSIAEKRLDIRMKMGANWDKAREMFNSPQRGPNQDCAFLSYLNRLHTAKPEDNHFMKALSIDLRRISVSFDPRGREPYIYTYTETGGSFNVSLDLLERRSLRELYIIIRKVARKTKLNELLYESFRDRALKFGIEVVGIPYQVKVFKGVALESVLLDAESLKLRTAKELVLLEHKLRSTGFAPEINATAADVISAYCSENIPR